eukprot:XP_011669819.1 PREDICTED: uncharacterized protein LOC105440909 [Strongylocentrotus purpuratus]
MSSGTAVGSHGAELTEPEPRAGQPDDHFLLDRDDDDDDLDFHDFNQGKHETEELSQEVKIPQLAAKFAVPSTLGRPINGEIADAITYMMEQKMEDKSLAEAADKYPCPENCDLLDVPKVNNTIWERMSTSFRSRDFKLQNVQKSLTKGICAFANTLDPATMTDQQQDALALLCDANFSVNSLRKDFIKPEVHNDSRQFCKPSNKVTKFLFGDNLGKQVKDLQDQLKVTEGVMMRPKQSQQTQYHPYKRYNEDARQKMKQAGWSTSQAMPGSSGRPFLGHKSWRGNTFRKTFTPHTYTPTAAAGKPAKERKHFQPYRDNQGRKQAAALAFQPKAPKGFGTDTLLHKD